MGRMKLWLLRPRHGYEEVGFWDPWYDRVFGFVIRAETEEEARATAQAWGGGEVLHNRPAWLDSQHSTCEILVEQGEPGVIIAEQEKA